MSIYGVYYSDTVTMAGTSYSSALFVHCNTPLPVADVRVASGFLILVILPFLSVEGTIEPPGGKKADDGVM